MLQFENLEGEPFPELGGDVDERIHSSDLFRAGKFHATTILCKMFNQVMHSSLVLHHRMARQTHIQPVPSIRGAPPKMITPFVESPNSRPQAKDHKELCRLQKSHDRPIALFPFRIPSHTLELFLVHPPAPRNPFIISARTLVILAFVARSGFCTR